MKEMLEACTLVDPPSDFSLKPKKRSRTKKNAPAGYRLEETTSHLKVVVTDQELKSFLFNAGCRFSMPYELTRKTGEARVDLETLYEEAKSEDLFEVDVSDERKAFFSWLKEVSVKIEEKIAAKFAEGLISASGLRSYLKPGMVLTFTDKREQLRAMRFESCNVHYGWGSASIRIIGEVLSHNGAGFTMGKEVISIPLWDGYTELSSLPFKEITPDLHETLLKRGKRWLELSGNPHHITYKGNMVRRRWIFINQFNATGRMMIDISGMKQADPDYEDYSGCGSRYDDEENGKLEIFPDNLLVLAVPYLYGFSFRCKKWGEVLVDHCQDIDFREDAFEKLVLENKTKNLLFGLVDGSGIGVGKDFVDGKGGGLIFLLHGAPGVGKTFTAEAISEKLHRPLYMISVGEIGTNAVDVETNLKDILETAQRWDAVLLLDECDIFLEKRKEDDMERNAVVSVFLRMIEYHQGILFMTTNRVNDLDPAFYSRISLPINYPNLDGEGKNSIWYDHLIGHGVREDLVKSLLSFREGPLGKTLGSRDFNGRQIKNIIRIAVAISLRETREVTYQDLKEISDYLDTFKESM